MPDLRSFKTGTMFSRDFGRRKFINVSMNRIRKQNTQGGSKTWAHPPEALIRGHIVYNVKFLGHVEVDQPKGIEVVKDAIRKMKFNKQIKRAEGQKPPKVELTISVDGVTVQEPKYKVIQHQYPLHRISYCADDKSDKRMFTFIAKEADSNRHHCFVFDSEKCAEEITLTIGQAFELAYKKFLETSNRDFDMKKQFLMLQKKVQQLTQENLELKARCADLERLVDPKVLENLDRNSHKVSPNKPQVQPVVGRQLENLVFDDDKNKPHTNGVTSPTSPEQIKLAPPPPVPARNNIPSMTPTSPPQVTSPMQAAPAPLVSPQQPQNAFGVDMFGQVPFTPPTQSQPTQNNNFQRPPPAGNNPFGDPFGMGSFNPNPTSQELDQQILRMDKELMDLQTGFSQGLSSDTTEFNLDDLDPFKK